MTQNWNTNGWLMLDNVFDPAPIKDISTTIKSHSDTTSFIYENDNSIRSIFSPSLFNNEINKFIKDNPIIPKVKELISNNIYVHQNHFNYKSALTGGEYAWHSDYTFWHYDDGMPNFNAISCLFLLDDMRIDNGPLEVLSGSHNLIVEKTPSNSYQIKHDSSESNGIISEHMVSLTNLQRHTVLGKAGDVFLMHANLWHTSSANTSNYDRNIFFVCYNDINNKITTTTRPSHIVSRDFSLV